MIPKINPQDRSSGSTPVVNRWNSKVPENPGKGSHMAKKLYVGNLSYNTYEENLRALFTPYGTVESVKIITDRATGNSKGFAFVEMSSDEEALAAINGVNSTELDGRAIRVNEAMDKPRREYSGRW
jgi:RNA recognition motif-containing protein